MPLYRTKPVQVQARQLTDIKTAQQIQALCGAKVAWAPTDDLTQPAIPMLVINNANGSFSARRGDWVILNAGGQYTVMGNAEFIATYEEIV